VPSKRIRRATTSTVRLYREIVADVDNLNSKRARRAFEKLAAKYGVPENQLRIRVDWFQAVEHFGMGRLWAERFNIPRARARRLAQRLRADANELRRALTPKFKFIVGYGSPISADFIIDLVGKTAIWIEGSLAETDNRKTDWKLEPRRELTQFIWRTAGRPLDSEVADLIAAILNLEKYTAEEQRKFRERHCDFEGTDSFFYATTEPDKIDPINV
jgi:hypothetical protein